MNSRERVTAAISRKPVDRVPLGFYAVDYDTVERVIGRPTFVRNKIEIQVALWEGRRAEVAESLKKDTVEFYRKIDCADILLPKEAQLLPPADYEPDAPKKIGEDLWEDREGRVYQAARHANEIQCVRDPGKSAASFSAQASCSASETPARINTSWPPCFHTLYFSTRMPMKRFLLRW